MGKSKSEFERVVVLSVGPRGPVRTVGARLHPPFWARVRMALGPWRWRLAAAMARVF